MHLHEDGFNMSGFEFQSFRESDYASPAEMFSAVAAGNWRICDRRTFNASTYHTCCRPLEGYDVRGTKIPSQIYGIETAGISEAFKVHGVEWVTQCIGQLQSEGNAKGETLTTVSFSPGDGFYGEYAAAEPTVTQ